MLHLHLVLFKNISIFVNSERIISELLDVRKKYSQTIFDLEKAKETIILLKSERKKLENEKVLQVAKVEYDLENAMNVVKISKEEEVKPPIESEQVNRLKKKIDDLKQENDVLKKENSTINARMKQIQSSIKISKNRFGLDDHDDSSEEEREYEVEQILRHKTNRNGRKFLVRWKGYNHEHDLWVDEENLNCAKILNAYLKSNKL